MINSAKTPCPLCGGIANRADGCYIGQPDAKAAPETLADALRAAEPYLETLHSMIPLGPSRRAVFRIIEQVRAALRSTAPQAGVREALEPFAKLFETLEKFRIERGDDWPSDTVQFIVHTRTENERVDFTFSDLRAAYKATLSAPAERLTGEAVALELVCSNKPRPSVQKGPKGNQHWARDVHHVRHAGKKFTLCYLDASDWLVIDSAFSADDPNLCKHCARVIERSLPPTSTIIDSAAPALTAGTERETLNEIAHRPQER